MPSDNSLEQIVLGYFEAYSTHNIDEITTFYSNNIEIYDGAFNSTVKGKEDVKKEVVEVFLGLVPDLKWQKQDNTEIVVGKNTLAIEWVFSGTPSADLDTVPEEHKGAFECKGMSVFSFDIEQGLITSHSDYYNPPPFFAYL